jgi:hypothetical protein
MKRFVAITAFSLTLVLAGVARAQDTQPAPSAEATPSSGLIELRLQTSSAVAASGGFGLLAVPGISYAPDSEILVVNVIGGAGYFTTPALAFGGDFGFTRIDAGDDEISLVTVAPFVKYVTGLPERSTGFFVEASPGVIIADGSDASGLLLQLGLWLGGHFPIGRSAGLMVGPYVTRLDNFDDFGGGELIVGLRFGMSVYL